MKTLTVLSSNDVAKMLTHAENVMHGMKRTNNASVHGTRCEHIGNFNIYTKFCIANKNLRGKYKNMFFRHSEQKNRSRRNRNLDPAFKGRKFFSFFKCIKTVTVTVLKLHFMSYDIMHGTEQQ